MARPKFKGVVLEVPLMSVETPDVPLVATSDAAVPSDEAAPVVAVPFELAVPDVPLVSVSGSDAAVASGVVAALVVAVAFELAAPAPDDVALGVAASGVDADSSSPWGSEDVTLGVTEVELDGDAASPDAELPVEFSVEDPVALDVVAAAGDPSPPDAELPVAFSVVDAVALDVVAGVTPVVVVAAPTVVSLGEGVPAAVSTSAAVAEPTKRANTNILEAKRGI